MFANDEQAAFYLGAMIDGEGSVIWRPETEKRASIDREVRISNTDEDILCAIREACDRLGISFGEYLQVGRDERHPKDCWTIRINGRVNFARIAEVVPIASSRKRAALERITSSYRFARPDRVMLERLYGTKTNSEIASELGVSKDQVQYWSHRYGIAA